MLFGDLIIFGDCDMMERVWKRATSVQELSSLDYDERHTNLQLPTLYLLEGTVHADMLMVYNILHQLQNVNLQPECFFHQNMCSVTRGHNYINFLNLIHRKMF